VILLFLHGWGFDASFWDELAGLLPEWRSECDDRGYFGARHELAPQEECLIVAHSFGAMRALASPPPRCRGLVAINGFDRFTAAGDAPGLSPRILDRMLTRFASEPQEVLSDFRRRCGSDALFGPADVTRLRDDLLALRDGDGRAQSKQWPSPILSLQGAQDPLLPAGMREGVFAEARNCQRHTHPDAGHLLPVSDAPYCARAIRAFVEQTA
jgi:pimeloyl-[acyl-carrier protein] methyl ester esterase